MQIGTIVALMWSQSGPNTMYQERMYVAGIKLVFINSLVRWSFQIALKTAMNKPLEKILMHNEHLGWSKG